MTLYRLITAAAAVALFTGAAHAQTAETTAPAVEPVAVGTAADVEPVAVATQAPAVAPAPAKPAFVPVVAKADPIETAKASGQFTVFLKAIEQTGLTEIVRTTPTLTVFAPTDAAFAALPAGELDRLMKTENATELQKLVVYHLVNAKVDSAKMKGAKGAVPTVAQTDLVLDGTSAGLKVNSANILQADVKTSTGMLHVIDHVLSPNDPAIAAAKIEAAANAAAAAAQPAEAPAS